jgi:hypothetical protein
LMTKLWPSLLGVVQAAVVDLEDISSQSR